MPTLRAPRKEWTAETDFGVRFLFAADNRAGLTHVARSGRAPRFAGYAARAPLGFYPDERERRAFDDEAVAARIVERSFDPVSGRARGRAVPESDRAARMGALLKTRMDNVGRY